MQITLRLSWRAGVSSSTIITAANAEIMMIVLAAGTRRNRLCTLGVRH